MTCVAIIIPAYNEELTISGVIEGFNNVLPEAHIWVINNRSSDSTEEVSRAVISRLDCKGGIINEPRPGKGSAVRRAFMDIEADIYVLVDGDLTYPADKICSLMEPIENGIADMVVGDRHSLGDYALKNKRALHNFGNHLVKNLVNRLFGSNLKDIMSGYRVFNKDFVKNYPVLVEGFEIETDMTLHALDKRFRVIEIPITYSDRPHGSVSKLNTVGDGVRVLKVIANILRHYRPLVFFGMAALISAFLGLASGGPVIAEWINTRFISHVPLAILATGLFIISIILVAIGLILDSTAQMDKRHFELSLIRYKSSLNSKK